MLINLPTRAVILLNVGGWLVIQLGLAWLIARVPASRFDARPPRRWERGGRVYERLFAIKLWKHLLPDAGRWFAGGFDKGTLAACDAAYLRRFLRETCRGETCHWLAILLTPAFFVWNPGWSDVVLAAYAVAANVPCILIQRYNRARLFRLLGRVAPPTGQSLTVPRRALTSKSFTAS